MALSKQIDDSFSTSLNSISSPNKSQLVNAPAPIAIVVDDDVAVPSENLPSVPHNSTQFSTNDISIDNNAVLQKSEQNISDFDANIDVVVQPASPHNPDLAAASSLAPTATLNKPPSSSSSTNATTTKPKSTKIAKQRSPSPSPPPPPPPRLRTVRLEIKLGGPDAYEVNIAQLAKDTGQRPPTPQPVHKKVESSDSEDEGEDGKSPSKDKKGKGKDGKRKHSKTYDLNDPFIDDSDLAIDQRQFYAQTKQQGFYVSSGDVALLKEKSPKKPKSKRVIPNIIPLATTTNTAPLSSIKPPVSTKASNALPDSQPQPLGTRDSPIALMSDNEAPAGDATAPMSLKRKTSIDSSTASQNGTTKKKRKMIEVENFHPELQQALNDLKVAISKESFEQKGKFPPSLKPVLANVALVAIRCGEYNDNFFSLMPKLFIYNKFTMTKLIKRTVFPEHIALLTQRQEELVSQLKALADEGFDKAKEEWEKSVSHWEKRQEKRVTDVQAGAGAATSTEGTPVPGSGTQLPNITNGSTANADEGESDAHENEAPPSTQTGGKAGKDANPPSKKYRMTESMKVIIWELVLLSNEACKIENEKANYEGSTVMISEQGARKTLYQRIVAAFPDGWMSSGYISREVSVMKKRFEAQQHEE